MQLSLEQKQFAELQCQRYKQHQTSLSPYLDGRGLAGAAERFRLGVVPAGPDDNARFHGRMSIPYLTPSGIVGWKYRCVQPHNCKDLDHPKYDQPAGQKQNLYNAHAVLRGGDTIFLTEGELDTIAIETLTGFPSVGCPGAQQWKAHSYWGRVFNGFDRVIIPADGDKAGREFADTVAHLLPEAVVVQLPDGEDANSLLAKDRAEFLRRCGVESSV